MMCMPKRCINSPSLKITEQKGFRTQTDLCDAHTAEILDHAGNADEFVRPSAKIGSLTRQFSM